MIRLSDFGTPIGETGLVGPDHPLFGERVAARVSDREQAHRSLQGLTELRGEFDALRRMMVADLDGVMLLWERAP